MNDPNVGNVVAISSAFALAPPTFNPFVGTREIPHARTVAHSMLKGLALKIFPLMLLERDNWSVWHLESNTREGYVISIPFPGKPNVAYSLYNSVNVKKDLHFGLGIHHVTNNDRDRLIANVVVAFSGGDEHKRLITTYSNLRTAVYQVDRIVLSEEETYILANMVSKPNTAFSSPTPTLLEFACRTSTQTRVRDSALLHTTGGVPWALLSASYNLRSIKS